jgi:hypothetical protein
MAGRALLLCALCALALAGRLAAGADKYDYGYDSYYDSEGGKSKTGAKDDFG